MINFDDINLLDCPLCGGAGMIQEEYGWCLYVQCNDCDAHTAEFPFKNEKEKEEVALTAAHLWNVGKVITGNPGE